MITDEHDDRILLALAAAIAQLTPCTDSAGVSVGRVVGYHATVVTNCPDPVGGAIEMLWMMLNVAASSTYKNPFLFSTASKPLGLLQPDEMGGNERNWSGTEIGITCQHLLAPDDTKTTAQIIGAQTKHTQ